MLYFKIYDMIYDSLAYQEPNREIIRAYNNNNIDIFVLG